MEDKPKVLVCDVPTVKVAEEAVLPVISKPTLTVVEIPAPVLEGTPAIRPLEFVVEEPWSLLLCQETIPTHIEIGNNNQRAASFLAKTHSTLEFQEVYARSPGAIPWVAAMIQQ